MKKGQEEAPIELLIAVTVLTFVLIIGFYTYENTCKAQFEQKMRASLSKFASDLELVYQGAQGTSRLVEVDFSPIGCSGSISGIKIVAGTDTTCLAQLGIEQCLFIVVTAPNNELPFIQSVNIPRDVTIKYIDQDDVPCIPTGWNLEQIIQGETPTCGEWKAQYYAFTVKKTSPSELEIKRG